jgi:hypothetical protein
LDHFSLLLLLPAAVGSLVMLLLLAVTEAIRDESNALAISSRPTVRLESSAHRRDQLDASMFESAVADIQLFGTARQVELVQALIAEFAAEGGAIMDDLIQDLRCDLRAELQLESVPDRVLHLRIRNDKRAA